MASRYWYKGRERDALDFSIRTHITERSQQAHSLGVTYTGNRVYRGRERTETRSVEHIDIHKQKEREEIKKNISTTPQNETPLFHAVVQWESRKERKSWHRQSSV